MDDEVTTTESDDLPPPAPTEPSQAHQAFFVSMVLLALIVIVTAVTLHTDNARDPGREPRCDRADVNVQLLWEDCEYRHYCDAEDGYLTRSRLCCPGAGRFDDGDVAVDCCIPRRQVDRRDGLFDAEADFADWSEPIEMWC